MQRLRRLGLSLMALTALGVVLSASAWAAGPPVNTVRPTLVIPAPKVGTIDTVTKGTWTNSPTSFAFQWQRCSSTGTECANIAGATSREYTVGAEDHGHTLVGVVTASNEAGNGVASSTASSPVTPLKEPEFISEGHKYPVRYTFSKEGGASWESAQGRTASCTSVSGSGEITGPDEVRNAHLTMVGCAGQGGFGCQTIESNVLHGSFGYINAATKEVGLVLGGETSVFSTFKCGVVNTTAQGQVIAKITYTKGMGNSFGLNYLQSKGTQSPNHLEEGPTQQLEWNYLSTFEKWGITGSATASTNVKGEFVS